MLGYQPIHGLQILYFMNERGTFNRLFFDKLMLNKERIKGIWEKVQS